MEYRVKILMSEFVTHDVKRFVVEKPEGYGFVPGQATEIAIDRVDWKDKKRPFTFTCLRDDLVLEFMIKRYPEHKGVTDELHKLNAEDELILGDAWGAINYRGEGVFIAGGTGITPFIAIFRELKKQGKIGNNKFIYSNKKQEDVILEKELKDIFGDNLILTLTQEKKQGYEFGRVDEDFLRKHINNFNQNFYVCGPKGFVEDMRVFLEGLGADVGSVVF